MSSPPMPARPIERLLAIGGAVACLVITGAVWVNVSAFQPMWPLPALYLIEVVALSSVATAVFILGGRRGKFVSWAAAGMLVAFCLLGAWSIGLLYVPVTVLLLAPLISYDVREQHAVGAHLAVCLLASVAQAALMLTVVRLI